MKRELSFYTKAFIIFGLIAAAVNFAPRAYNYAYNPVPGEHNAGSYCQCTDCKCWPVCRCKNK